jgi:putative ABC transport system permease protein
MTASSSPPRVARTLIAMVAERDDRQWVVADLDEMYAAKRERAIAFDADIWYWRQVVRSAPPLLARRMRPRRVPPSPSAEPKMTEKLSTALYYLRHAFRRLMREPAFTAAAVLTLALGIGGSVAVFALVEAVLLRPLPYPDAERLVILQHHNARAGITKEFIPIGDAVDIFARQSAFDVAGVYGMTGQLSVTSAPEPYTVFTMFATPGALSALGFRPMLGRNLQRDDAPQRGPALSVIIGYELWQERFAGDPRIVGKSLTLGETPRTIVGVAPRGFRFRVSQPVDLIVPNAIPLQAPAERASGWAHIVARVKAGRTIADAQSDLTKISRQLEAEFPRSNASTSYLVTPLRDILVGNTKKPLILLLAAVAVVLLVACVNVANLLLARSLSRRR